MDRLQLDKNAKLTGRVYFKDEVMWLGLSGSSASFTFDGTKLVLKLKGDNIAVGDNPRSEERRVGKECRSRWSPYH